MNRCGKYGITKRMQSTMSYKKGDILLVPFPYTDGSGSGKRPALIMSQEHHHKTYGHKLVCLMR